MTVDDAYAELGLPPGANLTQAKAAWRNQVSRWHPDRNGHASASARMQRINQALEQIRAATQGLPAQPSDAGAEPAQRAARTVQHRIRLTLEEVAAGCIKVLHGNVVDACHTCSGTGRAREPQDCAACAGQGQTHERTWFGWFGTPTPCTACDGSGKVRPVCPACEGRGKTEVTRYRVSVRLPPNLRDGDVLHVSPQRGRSAVAHDIHIEVLPHASLVRDDDGTVRCEWPVDGFAWIANRAIEIPTLRGAQPLGLQRGQVVYRLAGQGFPPRTGGRHADQVVIVVPQFPSQLSREQERLLNKLAATTSGKSGG